MKLSDKFFNYINHITAITVNRLILFMIQFMIVSSIMMQLGIPNLKQNEDTYRLEDTDQYSDVVC